jgi:hypothetical protein
MPPLACCRVMPGDIGAATNVPTNQTAEVRP